MRWNKRSADRHIVNWWSRGYAPTGLTMLAFAVSTATGAAVPTLTDDEISLSASYRYESQVRDSSGQTVICFTGDGQDDKDGTNECVVQIRVVGTDTDGIMLEVNGESLNVPTWVDAEKIANKFFTKKTVQFVGPENQLLHTMPRVMIGVYMEPIHEALASHLMIEDPEVVMLTNVLPGLPAERAGLRRWDIIKQCNGLEPITLEAFSDILNRADPNDLLHLVVIREGHEVETDVELEAYEPGMRTITIDRIATKQSDAGTTSENSAADGEMEIITRLLPGTMPQTGMGQLLIQPQGEQDIRTLTMFDDAFGTFRNDAMSRVEYRELRRDLSMVSERLSRLEAAVTTLLEIQMENLEGASKPTSRD